MASRYWVGGTATWNNTAGTKWSLTSGGAGGEAVPTSADDVFFDANSGVVTVTVGASSTAISKNLDFTGFTGTLSSVGAGSGGNLTVYGSLVVSTGMTWNHTGFLLFKATTTGHTITTNGKNITTLSQNNAIQFDGVGGGWSLSDNFSSTTAGVSLLNGTFNANNFNVTLTTFSSSVSNVRTLTMGNGTWTITSIGGGNIFDIGTTSNLTFNAGQSLLKFTGTGAFNNTFAGGGLTYYNVENARTGLGMIRVEGSNIFNEFKVGGDSITGFSTSGSNTFASFVSTATLGHLATITSASGTASHRLVKSGGGTVECAYLNIQHSVATPSSTWYAVNSVNNQSSPTAGSGWNFATEYSLSASNGSFLLVGRDAILNDGSMLNISKPSTSLANNSKPSTSITNQGVWRSGYTIWSELSFPWVASSPWTSSGGITNLTKLQ